MDFDGSDFEPINNDFSSNYNRSGGSSSNAKPVALNVRARNNVVPFPLISERKFGSTGVSDKQLNGAPVPDSGDDLWARDVFVFCQNGSTAPSILGQLSDSMQSLTILNQCPSTLQLAARCDGADTLLAVDLDMIPDIDGTIADLASIRRTNATLAVLIMSRSFVKSELHPHHSYIADASLRLPASKYETSVALHYAVTNAFFRTSLDDGV